MPLSDEAAEVRTSVPMFMVVNASELLERLAYYGVLSVTALYLSSIGYSASVIGAISAILLPLPYVVPMLAGPIAEKLGYKPVMLVAFVAYASGFLLIFSVQAIAGLVAGIVLVGVGAGMFKPLTAASIAHVTSPKDRTFGYAVYYVGINVGGFIGPILISLFGAHYRFAYLLGAATIGVDFLFILALFRNPVAARPGLDVMATFRPLLEVLRDRRFIVLLAVFSGFWVLYSMNFVFVILYLQSFLHLPAWFKPGLQVSLESLCVIVLGLPLGRLASRADAVRAMTLGIGLLVAGFLLLGFVPVFPAYVCGIVLIASGEVLAYPGFLSYVSRIAPRDRVAVYQSYGFLPLFVGFLLGPLAAGPLYQHFAQDLHRPAVFWAIMGGVGLFTLAAALLYARSTHRASPATAGTPAPWWQGGAGAAASLLLALALIGVGFAAGTRLPNAGGGTAPPPLGAGAPVAALEGTAAEGQTVTRSIAVPANAHGNLTLELTWTDEGTASPLPGASNQPDAFEVQAKDGFGTLLGKGSGSNPAGGKGSISFQVLAPRGNLTVSITLTSAGDTQFGGQTLSADTSNAWSLDVATAR